MLSAVFIPTASWERAPSPFCRRGLRHTVAAAASLPLSREQKTSSGGLRGSQHCPPPFLGRVLLADQVRTRRRPEGGRLEGCSRRMLSSLCLPGLGNVFRATWVDTEVAQPWQCSGAPLLFHHLQARPQIAGGRMGGWGKEKISVHFFFFLKFNFILFFFQTQSYRLGKSLET